MMKTILEFAERLIAVVLSLMSCMGMFLTGCLMGNMILGELEMSDMWVIFLCCLILTYVLSRLWLHVRCARLNMLVDELEMQDDEEAQRLCEHLNV